jgi:hypothetical protein
MVRIADVEIQLLNLMYFSIQTLICINIREIAFKNTARHAELVSASHMQSMQALSPQHASRRPGKREYPVGCRNKFGMTVLFYL